MGASISIAGAALLVTTLAAFLGYAQGKQEAMAFYSAVPQEAEKPEDCPEIGDVVVWGSSTPGMMNVGIVEKVGLQVAGQMHLDVLPFEAVGPRLYAPTPDAKFQPVMAKKLRKVEASFQSREGAYKIEKDTMFAAKKAQAKAAQARGGPVVDRKFVLEEYEALKKNLFRDAAIATALGIAGCAIYIDMELVTAIGIGGVGGMAYLYVLTQYIDNLSVDDAAASRARLRLAIPFLVAAALAVRARLGDGMTVEQAGSLLGQDPWNLLKLIAVPPRELAAGVVGFLCHRLPLLRMSANEFGAVVKEELQNPTKGPSLGRALADKWEEEQQAKKAKEGNK